MRILAIECATDACSAALFDGGVLLDGACQVIGRGHAERLVPMIAQLPGKGRADRILVSLGPGSFTGVRVGLAAARGLALAWGAPCFGYPTLALVAAMALAQRSGPLSGPVSGPVSGPESGPVSGPVCVAMSGGHGEWFVQEFGADGLPMAPLESLAPAAAAQRAGPDLVAGSQSGALAALRGHGSALDILPDARHALLVPHALITADLTPLYGRAPDATPLKARV